MSGYYINGTELLLQPTTGKWMPRVALGVAGDGHAIYAGVREFEMRFVLEAPDEYNQLITFFDAINPTGTAVVALPRFGYSTYEFFEYSGCILREPEASTYFTEHQQDILLIVSNIRT
ncbi:MAG: hypothetical protein ACXACY_30920 [Candidatus Hodarchaeales archaeon]|jgi:hypothetical protein